MLSVYDPCMMWVCTACCRYSAARRAVYISSAEKPQRQCPTYLPGNDFRTLCSVVTFDWSVNASHLNTMRWKIIFLSDGFKQWMDCHLMVWSLHVRKFNSSMVVNCTLSSDTQCCQSEELFSESASFCRIADVSFNAAVTQWPLWVAGVKQPEQLLI